MSNVSPALDRTIDHRAIAATAAAIASLPSRFVVVQDSGIPGKPHFIEHADSEVARDHARTVRFGKVSATVEEYREPQYDLWLEFRPGVVYRRLTERVAIAVRELRDGTFKAALVSNATFQPINSVRAHRDGNRDTALEQVRTGCWGEEYAASEFRKHPLEKAAQLEDWRTAARLLEELGSGEARELAQLCREAHRYDRHSTSFDDIHSNCKVRLQEFMRRQKEEAA